MLRIWLITLSLISNVLALALPLALLQVYDRILSNQAVGSAIVIFSAATLAILLDGCVRFARSALLSRIGSEAEYHLALSVAQQILAMKHDDLRRFGAGRVQELFAAVTRSRDVLVGQSTLALFDAPFAIIFLVLVWFLGGPVVVVPIAVTLFVGVVALGLALANRGATDDLFEARAEHKSLLVAGTSQVELSRSSGLAGSLMARLRATASQIARGSEQSERYSGALVDLTQVSSMAASVGILGFGAFLALQGDMTSGTIAACLMLGQRAVAGLVGILSGLTRRQTAAAANRKLAEVLAGRDTYAPRDSAAADTGPIGLVWVAPDGQRLNVSAGGYHVVTFDSFDQASQTFAALSDAILAAGNAASSLPPGGTFTLQGGGSADQRALADRVAMVRPMPTLLQGTLMENMTGFDPDRIGRAVAVAEQLGLDRPIARLAHGYQTEVGTLFGAPLSSGAIKRVGLVRALAGEPGLLVLNAPAHALDRDGERRLHDCLTGLEGRTTVLVLMAEGQSTAFAPAEVRQDTGAMTLAQVPA